MHASSLTVVVLTRNEEEHLPDCLRSVALLNAHVVVLDSGSTDRTRDIGRRAGATVWQRTFSGFADQRNAALKAAQTSWVLFIDADERLTVPLAHSIQNAISNVRDGVAALAIPRRNFAFGRVLRGGGWWPDHQVRLLRRDRARYQPDRQVHETVDVDGDVLYLSEPMIHLNYTSRIEFITKQRHYTAMTLASNCEDAPPERRRRYLGAPARAFWRRFITLGGYRDSLDGLFMALVVAFEELRLTWHLRRGMRA